MLQSAARDCHVKLVRALLDNGAYKEGTDHVGRTPLHLAASNGHVEIVKMLLEEGTMKEAPDDGGSRPLHYAATGGHLEVVRKLLCPPDPYPALISARSFSYAALLRPPLPRKTRLPRTFFRFRNCVGYTSAAELRPHRRI